MEFGFDELSPQQRSNLLVRCRSFGQEKVLFRTILKFIGAGTSASGMEI